MQIRTVVFGCRNCQRIRRASLTASLQAKSLSFHSHTQCSLAPTLGTWLDGPTQTTGRQTVLWKKNWCFFLRALSTSAQSLQHSLGFGFKSGFGFGVWFGFGFSFEFGSGFVFVFGSGFGLELRILAWSTLVDRGTESSYKFPCPGTRPLEREGDSPSARCSRQSSQQLDRQIFTSEVFLLSSATELLFFSLRFVFSSYFFTYFFFFAGQSQSLFVFSQPQAHSHFKLKIRKKHSGAHAQQRQSCRRNGMEQRWRTGAKGCCCCSSSCSCSCCREKRKKKFLLPPLAAVSLGSRRNKKEIKAKN